MLEIYSLFLGDAAWSGYCDCLESGQLMPDRLYSLDATNEIA